jgi:peptide/nickel transport system substrate-binding protein
MHTHRGVRVLAVVGSLAVSAALFAGCSDVTEAGDDLSGIPTPTEVPRPGGRIAYGLEADPNGLDPTRNAWDNTGLQLANALYDPLAAFDAEGKPQPYLAESFSANADYTVWTVKLRPGVVFSDGDPFNADALVQFQNALRTSAITGPPSQLIQDVQVIDELTAQLKLSKPWASLPALMSGQGGYVVSPKQLKDPEGHSHPIGTGPFILRKWDINRKFELVKNPRYWRKGLPYLDAVDFIIDEQGRTRIDKLAQGTLDITALTNIWDLRALDDELAREGPRPLIHVERDTGDAEKAQVTFNTSKAPLSDVRVRRAIAYATDVPAIAQRNGWPLNRLAQGPISPESPYFSPAPYPTHDVERAKALLKDYLSDPDVRGRSREIKFKVTAPAGGTEFATQLTEQWAQAGIKAQVEFVDMKQAVRFAVGGQFEALIFRYFAAPDPDILWHFFVNDTISDDGISLNFTHLHSDAITNGMNEGRASADPQRRKRAYAQVQKAFADEMPYLWLQRDEWRIATTSRVRAARNVSLPDGRAAMPYIAGTHRLTETWIEH